MRVRTLFIFWLLTEQEISSSCTRTARPWGIRARVGQVLLCRFLVATTLSIRTHLVSAIASLQKYRRIALLKVSDLLEEDSSDSEYFEPVNLPWSGLLICADSQSAMSLVHGSALSSDLFEHIDYVRGIFSGLISAGLDIQFLYCKAHVGIPGNEIADDLAREAAERSHADRHLLRNFQEDVRAYTYRIGTTHGLAKSVAKDKLKENWNLRWAVRMKSSSPLLDSLSRLQPSVGKWPVVSQGVRWQHTILARLRLGALGLNPHLTQINIETNPDCEFCNVSESVSHYLLECDRFVHQREVLLKAVNRLCPGMPVTEELLLCSPKIPLPLQRQVSISNAVCFYVKSTSRFKGYSL